MALVGGELDRDERYAAVVKITGERGSRPHCTATKIGPRRFLTAAHCVLDMDSGRLRPTHRRGSLLQISNAIVPKTLDDFIVVQVSAIHIHPDFRAGFEEFLASNKERVAQFNKKYEDIELARRIAQLKAKQYFTTRFPDAAIIEVEELTTAIPTAELDLESSIDNAMVTLVGYGCQSFKEWHQRSKRPINGERRWADTQVIRIDFVNFHSLARRMHANAPSLCPGDSGGPVLYKGKVVGVHGALFDPNASVGARSNMAVNLRELKRWQELSEPGPTDAVEALSKQKELHAE